jgi:hypothetical protein
MNEMVPRRSPAELAAINLRPLEPLVAELAKLREDVATADGPSQGLLDRLGRAIERVEQNKPGMDLAAAPARDAEAATFLGMLLKSFPNAGMQDARVYGKFMQEDVMSLQPTVAAMEFACRRWRGKSRFLPTISEILLEVKSARDELAGAVEFAGRLRGLHDRMAAELGR